MGLLNDILNSKTQVVYDPSSFTMANLTKAMEQLHKAQQQQPRQYNIYLDGYGMAVIKNDTVAIAAYERQHRIDRIRELRNLINEWGIFNAGIIVWLNKKGRKGYGNDWRIDDYGKWKYKEISNREMDDISLYVKLEDMKFSIRLIADDSMGYGKPSYDLSLSKNISFKSIINQINYFTKRLEAGAY